MRLPNRFVCRKHFHMPQPPVLSTPFAPLERVTLVDALRGFALLGLFLVHCIEYFELYWKDPVPSTVHDVVFFLFAGKAYALFALLFGWSFHTIMDRQATKGIDFTPRFVWRIVLLLALGWLHGLLYAGDILQVLAVLGLSLVLLHKLSARWILAISLFFLLNTPLLLRVATILLHVPGADQAPLHWSLGAKNGEVWANGTFGEVVRVNLWSGMVAKWDFFWASGRIFQLLGLFLGGLLIGRSNWFVHPDSFGKWKLVLPICLLFGGVVWFLQVLLAHHPWAILEKEWMARYYVGNWLEGLFALCLLTLWLFLLLQSWSTSMGRRFLQWLSPVGRMSLTIYVAQSVFCVPLFYGYGAGWYVFMGQGFSLLFGVVFFVVQVLFAHWWMKRFYYGPLEWCWRAATYGTLRIPLLRQSEAGN